MNQQLIEEGNPSHGVDNYWPFFAGSKFPALKRLVYKTRCECDKPQPYKDASDSMPRCYGCKKRIHY